MAGWGWAPGRKVPSAEEKKFRKGQTVCLCCAFTGVLKGDGANGVGRFMYGLLALTRRKALTSGSLRNLILRKHWSGSGRIS